MHTAPAFELTAPTPPRVRVPRVRPITLTMVDRTERGGRAIRGGTFRCVDGTSIAQIRAFLAREFFGSHGGTAEAAFAPASSTAGTWSAVDYTG